jgi:hypothetical protein
MDGFAKLELTTEMLRELTVDELAHVAGGVATTTCPDTGTLAGPSRTLMCPSGETWTANCQITLVTGA